MSSATVFTVGDLMKLHRGFVQRGEYRRLGRIVTIVLGEVPKDVTLRISKEEILREGRRLDWLGTGPLLGIGPGDVDLLVLSQMPPLPRKPDASFLAPVLTQAEIESGKRPQRAPLVDQLPEDRGARRMKGTNILLFEPVYQVLYRPIGTNVFGCVNAVSDAASATVPTFVWDFDAAAGYFYGGQWRV